MPTEIELIIKELSEMPEAWYYKEKMDLFIANYRALQQQQKQLIEAIDRASDLLSHNHNAYHYLQDTLKELREVD